MPAGNDSLISYKTKEDLKEELINILDSTVKRWFFSRFEDFSLPQRMAVKEIHSRKNILVSAPTGATKTLTGFLSVINELVDSAKKGILEDKVYCVYVSPLKALSYDIEVNLLQPLKEIEELYGGKLGIRVGVRTGDTTTKERAAMLKNPPHILITTPESLAIMLASPKFSSYLTDVSWCIIDEIHSLAENKRGTHLSLTLERLSYLSKHVARVGLSATIAPLDEIAKFLAGSSRPCIIVDVQFLKDIDLKVISPVDDLINTNHEKLHSETYKLIHKLIQEHKTTLIFTNTRSGTERVVHNLKEYFPKYYNDNNIGAHHGSLSKEHRIALENSLREGKMRCVVCSTSLELGLDIGFIDLVLMLGSPKSVARALQRCGRSGHKLHEKAKGRFIVMDRDDLVECSVLLKSAIEKNIDTIHIPKNALDVLSQQIVGFACSGKIHIEDLKRMVKSSYSYSTLSDSDFMEVIDYLSGKFVSLEERYVYAKIWYDPETGMIGKKGRLTRVMYMTNIGTIPEEAHITVKIKDQKVGTIDESFLEKLRPGDVFVIGGRVYEFKYSRGMTAQVVASPARPPTVPRWVSESLPLSFDLAMQICRFRRLIKEKMNVCKPKDEILRFIDDYLYVDGSTSKAIYQYFREQHEYLEIPSDKKIMIEKYIDNNINYYIFHTLFGRRVNDCISRAIAFAISRQQHTDVEISINDNGFMLASRKEADVIRAINLLKSEKLELVLSVALDKSEVMRRRFRQCAARSLMILRTHKGRTKRVGRQQIGSAILYNSVKRISNEFAILKEARREVLEDLMDIKNSEKIISMINSGKIKIELKKTGIPSPFAFNIVSQGYSDILKMEDKIEFLKRMHQMVIAKIALDHGKMKKSKSKALIKNFSYEKLWKEESEMMNRKNAEKIEDIKIRFLNIAKKIGLDANTKYEAVRLIEGDAEGFREDFIIWVKNLVEGSIPEVWDSDIIIFLKERLSKVV